MTTPQVHQPQHFRLAWRLALLAAGRNTQVMTLDSTVWIEARPDASVFHASNKATYIRVTIPTLDGEGGDWRHIVFDPNRQVRDIAEKCKATPEGDGLFSRCVTIAPTDDADQVEVRLIDPAERTSMTTEVPVHDLEWPFSVIAEYERHEADAQFSLGITPEFAQLFAGVTKLLGCTIPIAPDAVKASFDFEHPQIPDIRIEGVTSTKTS